MNARGRRTSIRGMAEEADAAVFGVIKNMRQGAKAADENNDPGTVDLFFKVGPDP